jgi:uncharacterized protein
MEANLETSTVKRIRFLDALRGIAVLGIYIANIGFFAGSFFFPAEQQYDWARMPSDFAVDFVLYTLTDGKFYTIFSLLFGIGCSLQFHKLEKNGRFKSFFRRRMLWLLIIGGTHLCLIWLGDILTLYALLGLVLMYFVNVNDKTLLRLAVILILLPILNDIVIYGIGWKYPASVMHLTEMSAKMLHITPMGKGNMGDFLKNEDWTVFFKTNLSNTFIRISRILDEGRPFKVLGIFLIGLWAGRKILSGALLENVAFLKKVAIWGVCIGLPLCIFRAYIEFFKEGHLWGFIKTVVYAFGTVPLALGYAALLALQYRKNRSFLKIFEPVGKMALTNYLLQTLISIMFFYGVGFGFAGKFGYTFIFAMALLVFSLQIVTSTLWLRRFKQGPIEWFWRYAVKGND